MGQTTAPRKPVVLVVEDEPILRMMAVDMVEDAGLEPIEAADATEAISILEARSDVRIMFTDVDMPRGMDGVRLAVLVRDRWPPIEIIITSGKLNVSTALLPPRSIFFSKPYRQDEVIAVMQSMAA